MTRLRELSPQEASAYTRATKHVRAFDHSSILLHLVHDSHEDLRRVVDRIHDCDPLADREKWDEMIGLEIEFDGALSRFLAAFRTYLDHTETRLKREYGKDSGPVSTFKVAAAEAYDAAFAYRFIYRLRNYIQHAGFPNWKLWAEGESPGGQIWRLFGVLTPTADPNELLVDGDDWGDKVRRDLEAIDERISIDECATEAVRLLEGIDNAVRNAEGPALRVSVQIIDDTVDAALLLQQYPMVAEVAQVQGKTQLTFHAPPATVMRAYGSRIPDGP